MPNPPPSPHFLAVLDGLLRMHRLSAAGLFESEEAEALRDSMDAPWHGLTAAERKLASGLSADLNALEDEPSPVTDAAACRQRGATWAEAGHPQVAEVFFAWAAALEQRLGPARNGTLTS